MVSTSMPEGDGFVVVMTLYPAPLRSLSLAKRFTRIDFTSKCAMQEVLEGMARVLKVDCADIQLESQDGDSIMPEQCLGEFHDRHSEPCASIIASKLNHQRPRLSKRQRKEIHLKVKHTASPARLVTCTVHGGEGKFKLRSATVQLPSTATFGEMLVQARNQRHGGLNFEGPVYGHPGELETTLRDAWVRNGCTVDGTLHMGRAVVVSFPGLGPQPLSLVVGPNDTIGCAKQRISSDRGIHPSRQLIVIRGTTKTLEDTVALKECGVEGVEAGSFSPAGWSELHLEMLVKEAALTLDCQFRATLSGDVGKSGQDITSDNFCTPSANARVHRRTPSSLSWEHDSCSRSALSPLPLFPTPDALGQDAFGHAKAGCADGSAGGRSAGYGACAIVFFALSPTGRALALTVSQAGTVLDAKDQVAVNEGVPPCRQRLLWRGVPLEPDHASLYELGVRSGDTLIVGYRVPRAETEDPVPAVDLEHVGNRAGTSITNPEGAGHTANSGDDVPALECPVEKAVVDDGQGKAEKGSENGWDIDVGGGPADFRASSSGRVDFMGGSVSGSSSIPIEAAVRDCHKPGGRRGWWSKKTPRVKNVESREQQHTNTGEDSGGSVVPSSASASTHRVSPAPATPASGAAGDIPGAAAPGGVGYRDAGGRQALTPSGGRPNFPGWGRWKQGRGGPTSPVSSESGGG